MSTVHQCPLALATILASNPSEVFPSCQSFTSYCLVYEFIQHSLSEGDFFCLKSFYFFIFVVSCILFICFILYIYLVDLQCAIVMFFNKSMNVGDISLHYLHLCSSCFVIICFLRESSFLQVYLHSLQDSISFLLLLTSMT